MNLEQALADYLTAHISTVEPAAVALPGSGMTTMPNSKSSVVCLIDLTHAVGPLWDAKVTIHISTPAKVAGYDLDTHNVLAEIIRALVDCVPSAESVTDLGEAAATALVKAEMDTALRLAGYAFTGHYLKTDVDKQDASMWQTSLELDYALEKV